MGKPKSNPSAPPEPAVNVDWDKINAKYWATVDKWIEQGLDIPATRQRKAMLAKASEEEARQAGKKKNYYKPVTDGPGRGGLQKPKYDVEAVVDRYEAGDTASQIAQDLGASLRTVISYLQKAGVYQPGRDVHRKRNGVMRKKVCDEGHDMEEHGRPIYRLVDGIERPNGRYCSECKRLRERVS